MRVQGWLLSELVHERISWIWRNIYKGRKHKVFPVRLLESYHWSIISGQAEPPPTWDDDDEDNMYNLEDMFDSKVEHRVVKYMVQMEKIWLRRLPLMILWEIWSVRMQVVRVLLAGDEAFAVSLQIYPRGGFSNGSAALPLCTWLSLQQASQVSKRTMYMIDN